MWITQQMALCRRIDQFDFVWISRHKLLNCHSFQTGASPLHWAQLTCWKSTAAQDQNQPPGVDTPLCWLESWKHSSKTAVSVGWGVVLLIPFCAKGGRLYIHLGNGQSVGVWYAHSNFHCWTLIRVLMMCHVQHEWIFSLDSHSRKQNMYGFIVLLDHDVF